MTEDENLGENFKIEMKKGKSHDFTEAKNFDFESNTTDVDSENLTVSQSLFILQPTEKSALNSNIKYYDKKQDVSDPGEVKELKKPLKKRTENSDANFKQYKMMLSD